MVEEIDKRFDMVECAICGRVIKYERSRLYWSPKGTFRTCMKGNLPHSYNQKKKKYE